MNYNLTLSSLHNDGHRLTKIRKSIIKIFSDTEKPLSVNTIGKRLKSLGVSADKATIYREINFLSKNGLINELFIDSKRSYYESAALKHHHHLICRNCGKVDNITNCLVKNLIDNVYKKRGFKIEKHILEFYGVCSSCAENI